MSASADPKLFLTLMTCWFLIEPLSVPLHSAYNNAPMIDDFPILFGPNKPTIPDNESKFTTLPSPYVKRLSNFNLLNPPFTFLMAESFPEAVWTYDSTRLVHLLHSSSVTFEPLK